MSGIDYEELARSVESVREVLKALVVGLVADGFTDEQAREIATAIMRGTHREEDK